MLEKVKLALRISHNLLDADIGDTINTARAEMVRVGIDNQKANNDNDPLIVQAIKTYCLWQYSNDTKTKEGYFKSWEYQIENIRKSNSGLEGNEHV